MIKERKLALLAVGVVLLCYLGYLVVGYVIPREAFLPMFAVYLMLFVGMFYLARLLKGKEFFVIVLVGLLFRVSLLLAPPFWSDDFYRFSWDGRLLASGENPYLWLPSESKDSSVITELGLSAAIYEGLNSKDYYTVYPPVHQAVFGLAAWLGNGNVSQEVFIMRLVIIVFDVLVMILLKQLTKQRNNWRSAVVLYGLNPLVIIELTGNLHFEGIMIAFLLGAAVLWNSGRYKWWSPVLYGLAVGVKLLPLIFLPLLFRKLSYRSLIIYFGLVGLTLVLLFAPFLSEALFQNMGSSVDLYFRTFEFNASFYYLLRELLQAFIGYNPIQWLGPALGVIVFLIVLFIAGFRKQGLFQNSLLVLSIYLGLATTVHPWYIITLLVLGILSNRTYPVIWSLLVVMSYAHYAGGQFQENYFLIALEYMLVGLAVWLDVSKKDKMNQLIFPI